MGTAERRQEILKTLCRRRYDRMENLAAEFGVSKRTIQRDIEALSMTEPIYTQVGKYTGGVYVTENFYIDRMYMSKEEICVLNKLRTAEELHDLLSADEKKTLLTIITQYTKPIHEKRGPL